MPEEMNETLPTVVYIQALSVAILYNTHHKGLYVGGNVHSKYCYREILASQLQSLWWHLCWHQTVPWLSYSIVYETVQAVACPRRPHFPSSSWFHFEGGWPHPLGEPINLIICRVPSTCPRLINYIPGSRKGAALGGQGSIRVSGMLMLLFSYCNNTVIQAPCWSNGSELVFWDYYHEAERAVLE